MDQSLHSNFKMIVTFLGVFCGLFCPQIGKYGAICCHIRIAQPNISKNSLLLKYTNGSGGRLGSRGNGCGYEGGERRMVDITRDKPIKVAVRVQVPVRDHPKFNFVGKLLGPKGNSLKRLQEDTMCKMAVLGRGSMKDRQKEEELRVSGDPKFSHLMEDLHVEISAYATPAEAHARIAYALAEVRRFLVPDYNDDIRQEQMLEMQILNTRGREAGGGGQAPAEAPLSPASSLEAAGSPTAATTPSSLDGLQEECAATRPTPSPPHSASLKVQAGTILPSVTSGLGGRKRPLLPGALPAMSPTKRTVMSLLARASAAQNKDSSGLQPPTCPIVAAQPQQPPGQQQHQAQAVAAAVAASPLIQAALQLSGAPASATVPTVATQQAPTSQQQQQQQQHQVTQLHQLAAAAAAAQSLPQRQPLLQSHSQHPVLAPTIHGLLHAQRAAAAAAAAAGPTVLPILREDFMAGVNQHQVQNVHIT